jgi:hypothetical protein
VRKRQVSAQPRTTLRARFRETPLSKGRIRGCTLRTALFRNEESGERPNSDKSDPKPLLPDSAEPTGHALAGGSRRPLAGRRPDAQYATRSSTVLD